MIGYDLNKPGRDYGPLTEAIKNLASNGRWWHHLDSTWIVVTDVSAGTARDSLKKHLDSNDELLIVDVTGRAGSWTGFSDSGSRWLKDTYQ